MIFCTRFITAIAPVNRRGTATHGMTRMRTVALLGILLICRGAAPEGVSAQTGPRGAGWLSVAAGAERGGSGCPAPPRFR